MLLIKLVFSLTTNLCSYEINHAYYNILLFQFLTELDGVEVLTGVFVFAATRYALVFS